MKRHDPPREGEAEEAERRERLAALYQRRSALTRDEIELFQQHYENFYDEHYQRVCKALRRRGLRGATLDEQVQESFASFFFFAVDKGFPDSIPAKLCSIAAGHALNLRRAEKDNPTSPGVPSSRSEPARVSDRGPERRMDLARIRQVLPSLSANQQVVVQAIYFEDKTQEKAAEDLNISREALCNRLAAARRQLRKLLAFLPESQRGTP